MIKRIILLTLSLTVSALALLDPWSVNVNDHTAVQRTYKQGESWTMQVSVRDGLKPLDLTGATAKFYWYTNTVQNIWWTNSAAIPAPKAGLVTAQWTPAMDCGAASYAYWFGIWMPGSTSPLWRVTGTIRMLTSPGFKPNEQQPPVRTLDFAAIAITNAPWVTASDWETGSNALASALQAEASARIAADAQGFNNVTASVSAEAALRIAGDLAGSNAVTAAASASSADLSAFAQTNRTTRLYGEDAMEWIDGTGGVWRVYQIAVTNDAQRIMWDSGLYPEFGLLTLDQIAPNQWRIYLDNDLYAYFGDIYQDEIAHYVAVGQTDEWPYGLTFYQAEPPWLNTFPKTYSRGNGQTGWVDRVISYHTVTQGVDRVRFFSDDAALTNTILQAVANSYPNWPTNYIAGFVLPIPGTNVLYTLSVDSNRTLSVWEVVP